MCTFAPAETVACHWQVIDKRRCLNTAALTIALLLSAADLSTHSSETMCTAVSACTRFTKLSLRGVQVATLASSTLALAALSHRARRSEASASCCSGVGFKRF